MTSTPQPKPHPRHLRRWGAVYLLLLLFAGSWAGQVIAMNSTINEQGWSEFWAATMENWQSEYLQLVIQAVFLLGAKHWIFQADAEDLERIEAKVDTLIAGQHPGERDTT